MILWQYFESLGWFSARVWLNKKPICRLHDVCIGVIIWGLLDNEHGLTCAILRDGNGANVFVSCEINDGVGTSLGDAGGVVAGCV